MYLCVGAIGLFTVYDLVYWRGFGHVFVCWGYMPFLCLVSCLLDSDWSCICMLGLSAFSLSTILYNGEGSVMYLCVGAIGLFSVYDLVYWTVIGHVFSCWGYRPFLCLKSCLLTVIGHVLVLGLTAFSLSRILSIGQ